MRSLCGFGVAAVVLLLALAGCAAASMSTADRRLYAAKTADEAKAALAVGAALNARHVENGQQTPLMSAVLQGRTAVVEALLAAGADFTIPEKDGYTPMHGAGFQGRDDIVPLLAARGVPVSDVHHTDGYTPLQRACWGSEPRHTATVRALLRHGASPEELKGCHPTRNAETATLKAEVLAELKARRRMSSGDGDL